MRGLRLLRRPRDRTPKRHCCLFGSQRSGVDASRHSAPKHRTPRAAMAPTSRRGPSVGRPRSTAEGRFRSSLLLGPSEQWSRTRRPCCDHRYRQRQAQVPQVPTSICSYIAEFRRYRWPSGYRRSLRLFKLTVGVALSNGSAMAFCQRITARRITARELRSGCTIFWPCWLRRRRHAVDRTCSRWPVAFSMPSIWTKLRPWCWRRSNVWSIRKSPGSTGPNLRRAAHEW